MKSSLDEQLPFIYGLILYALSINGENETAFYYMLLVTLRCLLLYFISYVEVPFIICY
jgi:hypothetical protein